MNGPPANPPFQRLVIPELMDAHDASPEELAADLRDLMKINRLGWGTGLMRECFREVVRRGLSQPGWSVLDVATGAADVPRSLVRWGRAKGVRVEVTATDFHPVTLEFARNECRDYPEIRLEPANLLDLPYADHSFDVVTCALALHHFGVEDILRALRGMARVARRAVIVSDLVRSLPGLWFVWTAVHVGGGSKYVLHDAPASMKNGFKLHEMRWLARQAGMEGPLRFRHRLLRFSMTWLKPAR